LEEVAGKPFGIALTSRLQASIIARCDQSTPPSNPESALVEMKQASRKAAITQRKK
jgi:hypothetical protein